MKLNFIFNLVKWCLTNVYTCTNIQLISNKHYWHELIIIFHFRSADQFSFLFVMENVSPYNLEVTIDVKQGMWVISWLPGHVHVCHIYMYTCHMYFFYLICRRLWQSSLSAGLSHNPWCFNCNEAIHIRRPWSNIERGSYMCLIYNGTSLN